MHYACNKQITHNAAAIVCKLLNKLWNELQTANDVHINAHACTPNTRPSGNKKQPARACIEDHDFEVPVTPADGAI